MNAVATRPSWSDGLTGGEMPSEVGAAAALDDFASTLRLAPRWVLETGTGGILGLRIHTQVRGEHLEIVADLAGTNIGITLEPDPSGWLSIGASRRQQEIFRARLDRPYEGYEFWPENADVPPHRTVDAPGRIGKRRNWITLSAEAWPQLAGFTNASGHCVASEAVESLRQRSVNP
ncbi:hypothetical protein [Fodinicurvata sp. EGI_FJ10296]|uniref:hypothetical protein n=1 Tax=Fodinicurvata sp. EGI_FJ10296 TaxID=3231908 RepID=UPI0034512F38